MGKETVQLGYRFGVTVLIKRLFLSLRKLISWWYKPVVTSNSRKNGGPTLTWTGDLPIMSRYLYCRWPLFLVSWCLFILFISIFYLSV